jgi:ParB-like chromosome segregation protein Spo0J
MDTIMNNGHRDIPIVNLLPLNERRMSKRAYKKLVASIKAVGLIEPLCVYQEGDQYIILDGYLRHKVCMELGIESLPCLVLPNKEAYTINRYVNQLSPTQETRMLQKSLETLDESVVAEVFGLKTIRHRLDQRFLKELHPRVVKAYDGGRIVKTCAQELAFVMPARQVEILDMMEKIKDFSTAYVRTQVLRTPTALCKKKKKKNPWAESTEKKQELVKKLEQAENRYDFYSGLYRQYVTDLLKMCIYLRRLVTKEKIRAYLQEHHAEMLQRVESILFETEGKKVG